MSNLTFSLDIKKLEQQLKKQQQEEKRQKEKQAREQKRQAEKLARISIANSIVEKQPIVEGVKMLDGNSEIILQFLLQKNKETDKLEFFCDYKEIPEGFENGITQILDTLQQYGMIFNHIEFMGSGFQVNLSPLAVTYFEDKEKAIQKQQEKQSSANISIQHLTATGSSFNFGTMTNSNLTSANILSGLEKEIEQKGGKDKEELKDLLEQVKELCENIKIAERLPKSKTLLNKISNHLEKHGWFYGAVVNLIGTAAIEVMKSY